MDVELPVGHCWATARGRAKSIHIVKTDKPHEPGGPWSLCDKPVDVDLSVDLDGTACRSCMKELP